MVPVFAFVLQDQIEQYGAYFGIVAFLGLAVLIVLYFAQAREVKRLRELAAQGPSAAAAMPSAQGAAAGPVLPQRKPAVPAAARVPAATAAAKASTSPPATPATDAEDTADETRVPATAGAATGAVGADTGVAAGAAVAAGPRVPTPPSRPRPPVTAPRAAPAGVTPPRHRIAATTALREEDAEDEGGSRGLRLALITLVVVLVAAGAVIGGILLLGGDGGSGTQAGGGSAGGDATATATATATPRRAALGNQRRTTGIGILNGTQTAGLALAASTDLTDAGYVADNIGTGNGTDKTVRASTVYYADGKRTVAEDIAEKLGITEFAPLTTDLQVAASPTSGRSPVVVVMLGADKVDP